MMKQQMTTIPTVLLDQIAIALSFGAAAAYGSAPTMHAEIRKASEALRLAQGKPAPALPHTSPRMFNDGM